MTGSIGNPNPNPSNSNEKMNTNASKVQKNAGKAKLAKKKKKQPKKKVALVVAPKVIPQALPKPRPKRLEAIRSLGVIKRTLHPGVPKVSPNSRRVFDLRDRTQRRNLALSILHMFKDNAKAKAEVAKILGGEYAVGYLNHGIVKLAAVTAALENEHIAESAAHEMNPGHEPKMHEMVPVRKHVLKKIENELVEDELETNAVGQMYYDTLLNPCNAPNPGFPDEENRSMSMKLRVRTVMLIPMTNDEAYIIVSRNPAKHIQIEEQGGSQTYFGPKVTARTLFAGHQSFYDEGGKELFKSDSFVGVGALASALVSAGYDKKVSDDEFTNENGETLDLSRRAYNNSGSPTEVKFIPCAAGDTVQVQGWTSDTTASNYACVIDYLTQVGNALPTLVTFTGGAMTGTGVTNSPALYYNLIMPANSIGVVRYGYKNLGVAAGTTTIYPALLCRITLAASPLTYPIGSSDLADIGFLNDYADDVRVVGCRVTVTYVAKKLEGGYIVGGQLPQAGDDDIPGGSLGELAIIPGMVPRALNGVTPGISFPIFPLNQDESDYKALQELYDDDTFSEGAIQIRTTGADADLIILQTEMSLQARTERQVLMATTGEVDLKAISDVHTNIARRGPLSFVTGNDEHEEVAKMAVREYAKDHPTYQFFNGWFSGNNVSFKC